MTANAPGQKPESAADLIELLEVREAPLPDGDTGEGLRFRTNRGEFNGIVHHAPDSDRAVIWVCGARGGFGGPGPGTYAKLAEELTGKGITSVRLDYRIPSDLLECVLDLLAGVTYCKSEGCDSIVVVGHSFGGAVVIAGGASSPDVKGVVSLSPQTHGAGMAGRLAPRRLLVAHGKADTRLPFYCAQQIYDWAKEPKELVLFEGAEHRLEECKEELETLLAGWIPATLAEDIQITP